MRACTQTPFVTYASAVPEALDLSGLSGAISGNRPVLIKPNLINASPHPVTTPPDCCRALVKWLRTRHRDIPVVIAEGCGDPSLDTSDVFHALGYDRLAADLDIDLLDLNHAPLDRIREPANMIFSTAHYPEIAFSHFVISVPVLKAHSLADITGSLKNMVGFAPPEHYSGSGGYWKKAVFHQDMQLSITEWCRLRLPDFTIMDASIGLADFHLGGRQCDPPVKKIIAGKNPLAVDRLAADLLGRDWRSIGHLDETAQDAYGL